MKLITIKLGWMGGQKHEGGQRGARLLIRFIYFINRFLFQKINFFVTFLNNSQNERIIINWKIMLMSGRYTHKYMIEREREILSILLSRRRERRTGWMDEGMNECININEAAWTFVSCYFGYCFKLASGWIYSLSKATVCHWD